MRKEKEVFHVAAVLATFVCIAICTMEANAQGFHADGTPVGQEANMAKGPIEPAGFLTDKGLIVPKRKNGVNEGQKGNSVQEKPQKPQSNVVQGLSVNFGEPPEPAPTDQSGRIGEKGYQDDAIPSFVSQFQIEDARKLEDEYKIIFEKSPIDLDKIREQERNKKLEGSNRFAAGFSLGSRKPKWKYLGIREISGKRKAVWQTAIVVKNAIGLMVGYGDFKLPAGSELINYGLSNSKWKRLRDYYIGTSYISTPFGIYRGDTVVIEYYASDVLINADINSIVIIERVLLALHDYSLSSLHEPETNAKTMAPCAVSMCEYKYGDGLEDY
ncbi:MAG: hypothetical protein OEV92_06080 [Nitrospinota bacterium]|nr:hypothetical protein [Nitrospinota bacterium]